MLTNYDQNVYDGKHEIKISFQRREYKGYVTKIVGGNCKGLTLLQIDADDLYDIKFKENPVGFKDLDEDWFSMTLKNGEDELLVEDEFDSLGRYIVGVEIIGFETEESDNY